MPYVYAHAFCGERTLELLKENPAVSKKLSTNKELFLFGCQGPDPWFYHNSYPLIRKRSYAEFGELLHRKNVDAAFAAMLTCVREGDTDRRFAYFAGYLCHYALDTSAHPYVVYFTEEPRFHTPFEAAIDIALLNERGETLLSKPLPSMLAPIPAPPFAALHSAAAKALGYPLPDRVASEPPAHMIRLLPAIYDPRGRKFPLYKILEIIWGKKDALTGKLFYPNVAKGIDALNLAHQKWQEPWSEEIRTDSFLNIMEIAAKKAAEYATLIYDTVYKTLSPAAALEQIGKLSFDTGLDWRINPPMLHFNCAFRSKTQLSNVK